MPENALNLAGFNEDTDDNIYENRRRFLNLFSEEWTLALSYQTHSADVRIVTDNRAAMDHSEECDALITQLPNVLLGVKTADCVPVILADVVSGAVAAIHAGWRGTLASIVIRAIEQMQEQYGTKPNDIHAGIGPAALGCCYEVGDEVIKAFEAKFRDAASSFYTPTRPQHFLIDLHHANKQQLVSSGVLPEHIYATTLCTMCRTDLFFSYRKEKRLYGRTGRLMSVIGRKN
jgi:polyphenol oxidase